MKITRILPRNLVKTNQEKASRWAGGQFEYHKAMVRVFEGIVEGRDLPRLDGED